jgi:hypothetical protein
VKRIGIFRALSGLSVKDPNVLYPASVLQQHADGRIDVRCDAESLGDWSRVRLWAFAPGVKVKVAPKTRVLVGFAGILRLPFAIAFQGSGLLGLEIGNNGRGAARLNDRVRVQLEPGSVVVQTTNGPASNIAPIIAEGEIISASEVVKIA